MKHKDVNLTISENFESTPPPPPPQSSPFSSIRDWLFNMCDIISYDHDIDTIHFRLVDAESNKKFTLWFHGTTAADEAAAQTQPRDKRFPIPSVSSSTSQKFDERIYYPLKESETLNLTREEVHQKIFSELKDFLSTDKFKESFFSRARSIVVDFNDEVIWK